MGGFGDPKSGCPKPEQGYGSAPSKQPSYDASNPNAKFNFPDSVPSIPSVFPLSLAWFISPPLDMPRTNSLRLCPLETITITAWAFPYGMKKPTFISTAYNRIHHHLLLSSPTGRPPTQCSRVLYISKNRGHSVHASSILFLTIFLLILLI